MTTGDKCQNNIIMITDAVSEIKIYNATMDLISLTTKASSYTNVKSVQHACAPNHNTLIINYCVNVINVINVM